MRTMQIISHYANVPLSMVNIATEHIRAQNKQRPTTRPLKSAEKSSDDRQISHHEEQATEQEQQRFQQISERQSQEKYPHDQFTQLKQEHTDEQLNQSIPVKSYQDIVNQAIYGCCSPQNQPSIDSSTHVDIEI